MFNDIKQHFPIKYDNIRRRNYMEKIHTYSNKKREVAKATSLFIHIYHQVTTASAVNVSAAHHTPPYINVEGIS